MFYLTSRGLDEFEAIKLLVKAKFSKITNDIFDEETNKQIPGSISFVLLNNSSEFIFIFLFICCFVLMSLL